MLNEKQGLWANIHAKRKRIAAGSGERMRKPGEKGAPTPESIRSAKNEEVEISEDAETGLAAKAKKSGVSVDTLRKVYRRGVAAWRTGHRPGTTPQQWGMARVNSYITKGKTYHTTDKDLREAYRETKKDPDTGIKKSYSTGVDSTDKARLSHWKKTGKMDPKNKAAYEPAPGDKSAETKPSKYTRKYHKMFGENAEKHSKDPKNPASRFDASDELVKTYKDETPGQSKTLRVVKKVVEEALYECNGNCTCGKNPPVNEAEYQGRNVPLGKPMKGDVKKSKVYVRNEKGNVIKVEFGDPNMTIKKHIPGRRKNFRARHNCDTPGPRTKARYWSCRAW